MSHLRDVFLNALCNFTHLHAPGSMRFKNALAFKAMLRVAETVGDQLQERCVCRPCWGKQEAIQQGTLGAELGLWVAESVGGQLQNKCAWRPVKAICRVLCHLTTCTTKLPSLPFPRRWVDVLRCISRWELLQQVASGMPTDAALFSPPEQNKGAIKVGGGWVGGWVGAGSARRSRTRGQSRWEWMGGALVTKGATKMGGRRESPLQGCSLFCKGLANGHNRWAALLCVHTHPSTGTTATPSPPLAAAAAVGAKLRTSRFHSNMQTGTGL